VDGVLGANIHVRDLPVLPADRPRRRCGNCAALARDRRAVKNLKKVAKFLIVSLNRSGSLFI
jgi:hypothetical protein